MSRTWLPAAWLAVHMAGLAALGWQGADGAAEEKPATESLPADLARVPVKSVALLSVRSADVWSSTLARGLRDHLGKAYLGMIDDVEKKTGLSPADFERVTLVIRELPDAAPMIFFATTRALDAKKVFARAVPGGSEEKYGGATLFANDAQAAYVLGPKAFVLAGKGDIQSLIDAGKDRPTDGLAPAVARAAKKHSLVVAVNPSLLSDVVDKLPSELEPFKPLFKATSLSLTLDLKEKTTGQLHVVFPGAGEAAEGVKAVEAGRTLALGFLGEGVKELSKDKSAKALVGLLEDAHAGLKVATIKRDGSAAVGHIEVKIEQAVAGSIAADAWKRMRASAGNARSANNLKQIALAMHNYHDATGSLPAQAIYDKDGKALLSWRVLILPYIEQANLYNQFHLNEAWDSEHNKKLLEYMPKTYMAPGVETKHAQGTFYQAFAGKGAFFEGKKGLRFGDFTDGLSNTFMVVEAGQDVPWSKPEDLSFVPDKPLPKLGGVFPGVGFNAALCDGAVRFFSSKTTESTLKKYITRNGDEIIGPDDR